jgi:hypothetical protein
MKKECTGPNRYVADNAAKKHSQPANRAATTIRIQFIVERDRSGLNTATQLQIIPSAKIGTTETSTNASNPTPCLNPPPIPNAKSEPKIKSDERTVFRTASMIFTLK